MSNGEKGKIVDWTQEIKETYKFSNLVSEMKTKLGGNKKEQIQIKM